eukprot:4803647-Prymnesium_polylepis.1
MAAWQDAVRGPHTRALAKSVQYSTTTASWSAMLLAAEQQAAAHEKVAAQLGPAVPPLRSAMRAALRKRDEVLARAETAAGEVLEARRAAHASGVEYSRLLWWFRKTAERASLATGPQVPPLRAAACECSRLCRHANEITRGFEQ